VPVLVDDREWAVDLVHLVVPAIAPGRAADWTGPTVDVRDAQGYGGGSVSFKVTAGFVGEFAWAPFGTYRVTVQTVPSHRVIADAAVTLDAERPYAEIPLQIPPGSLGCDDGWWSACPNPPAPTTP